MKKIFAVSLLLVTLTACATPTVNQVGSLQSRATTADGEARKYFRLPTCTKLVTANCKTKAIVQKVMTTDQDAYTALQAADQAQTSDTIAAAGTKVTIFENLVSTLPKAQ